MNLIYSLSDKLPAKFKTGAKDLLFKLKKVRRPRLGDETKGVKRRRYQPEASARGDGRSPEPTILIIRSPPRLRRGPR